MQVRIWIILSSQRPDKSSADILRTLEGIPHATSPDTSFHGQRKGCLNGTREAVLSEIEAWIGNPAALSVYWLNGLAGTGKSTIAQTIARGAFANGRLLASFFCSRDFEDRSNLRLILPTIAYQLALAHESFRSNLLQLMELDPQAANGSLNDQMDRLLVRPLKESNISTVIVIDALDECRDEESSSAILSVIGRWTDAIPGVKFFLTGRPEPRILNGFRLPLMKKATHVFVLHEVKQDPKQDLGQNPKQDPATDDIRRFFEHEFLELSQRHEIPEGWPTKDRLDLLCDRAGNLFVYAVATVKFLEWEGSTPQTRLDQLMESPWNTSYEGKTEFKLNKTLDSLYLSILQEAYKESHVVDYSFVRSVLGAVVLTANPLPPSTIATILRRKATEVHHLLSVIRSLLILHDDPELPVRTFHKSFPDFLTDSTRCPEDTRLYVSIPDHQVELLVKCLELMDQQLETNISIPHVALTASEEKTWQEERKPHIGSALKYACESWYKHLDPNHPRDDQVAVIAPVLHRFMEEKFLFWLEALSLLGSVRNAIHALDTTIKWLKVCLVSHFSVSLVLTQARTCPSTPPQGRTPLVSLKTVFAS